jgi:leucine efflux protein
MIYGITDLTAFVLGTIFIVLLPGPNSLLVMTIASRTGPRAGAFAASGIVVGDTILMLLAATGAASVLHASPLIFTVLKILGGAYLGWLGIGLIRAGMYRWRHRVLASPPDADDRSLSASPHHAASDAPATSGGGKISNIRRPFRSALLVSLVNPKAIFFFVSFFVQFVDPHYPYPALSFLLLGLVVQICSILYLTGLVLSGQTIARRLGRHPAIAGGATIAVGAIFVGFALRLALAPTG